MKYTNYIINGKVIDIEQLISSKRGLKEITTLISIPVAFTALAAFTAIIPLTVSMDTVRNIKCRYYHLQRKYKTYKHYEYLLSSLSMNVDNRIRTYLALKDISNVETKINAQIAPRYLLLKGMHNAKVIRKKLTFFNN